MGTSICIVRYSNPDQRPKTMRKTHRKRRTASTSIQYLSQIQTFDFCSMARRHCCRPRYYMGECHRWCYGQSSILCSGTGFSSAHKGNQDRKHAACSQSDQRELCICFMYDYGRMDTVACKHLLCTKSLKANYIIVCCCQRPLGYV